MYQILTAEALKIRKKYTNDNRSTKDHHVLAIDCIFPEHELSLLNTQFQILSKSQSKNFIFILQMKKWRH